MHKCSFCDYQTYRRYQLQHHIDSIHNKCRYTCNHCPKSYSFQINLKNHIKKHHFPITSHLNCKICKTYYEHL